MQQTVFLTVVIDISRKYVGGILGLTNMIANVGGFLFSVSFGYFVAWFGSYDLALILVALMLTIAALAWLRVDATEELIPEAKPDVVPDAACIIAEDNADIAQPTPLYSGRSTQ